MPDSLSRTIRRLLRTKYADFAPYEVNDGLCERFAHDVLDAHPSASECSTGLVFRRSVNYQYPVHVWVYEDGQHYDAEAPDGVETFAELPFWKRTDVEISNEHLVDDSQFVK